MPETDPTHPSVPEPTLASRIPPQTIVTCLYDLSRRGVVGARTLAYYQAHAELTLAQPLPLVAYVDPWLVDWLLARRRQFGQERQTRVVARPLEELPLGARATSLARLVGIENGEPGKDDGWHLVVNLSKVGLLAQAAQDDPFGTGRFAWVDLGLGHVARRPEVFPEPCDTPTLLQMKPVFEEELDEGFHHHERGRVAAGFLRGGRDPLVRLGARFSEELERALLAGRVPTDQTVLGALSARCPEMFDFVFGDYPSILSNWDLIRGDEETVLANVEHCLRFGRWDAARQRCRLLRTSLEAGTAHLGERLAERLGEAERLVADHLDAPIARVPLDAGRPGSRASVVAPPATAVPATAVPATALPATALNPATGRETVALCMIVKDEAQVIRRCLDSVRDVIDTWVVVDTGSSDGTPEVVAECLEKIPGKLVRRPWRDFGTNRTELLALVRGTADYLLLMDADMTLNVRGALPTLGADGYRVVYEGPFRYWVPRLVRGDRPWHFVGATHEYLSSTEPFVLEPLTSWTVTHHADGGSRKEKFARDLVLLERQLERMPDDPRTVFYLAQTCRDLGDRRRAAELYRRRVSLGGWQEEVFYAALQLGVLVADDDWPAGSALLVDAWERRPSRSEPLYELAVRARSVGDFTAADWATEVGLDIPMPDDVLFVHAWVYEWGMCLERSIATARMGRLTEALALTDELLGRARLDGGLPAVVVEALRRNRRWLCDHGAGHDSPVPTASRGPESPVPTASTASRGPDSPVPTASTAPRGRARRRHLQLRDLCPSTDIVPLPAVTLPFGWTATNPSVASGGAGLAAIARAVNYEIVLGRYRVHDARGAVRTDNWLLGLAPDLSLLGGTRLAEPPGRPRCETGVLGFEDCRLLWWRDGWWAVATARDLDPEGICRMVLLSVDGDRWRLEAVLEGPDPGRHEKNWMPFVAGDRLHFVYGCRPFVVLTWDEEARRLQETRRVATDWRFAGLRGGSQGLPVDEGFLFVVHEARRAGQLRPTYLHRFVTLDATTTPSGISPAFAFVHDGIEFCAGLARRGGDLLVSFGVEDRVAAVAVVPLDEVVDVVDPLGGPGGEGAEVRHLGPRRG